jgi:predicted permease
MVGMIQDLRSGLRVFRRAPGFAMVVVLTLGVGVGAAAAVFSVVRGVLLTPLAFEEPDRLVMLWGRTPDYPKAPLTVGDYHVLARDVDALAQVSAGWGNNTLILGESAAEQVGLGWVTPGYFDMLRVRPMLGRTLGPADEAAIVVSHDLWVRRWGADPSVVGRTVRLTDGPFEIAGVLPPDRNPNPTGSDGTLTGYEIWRLQPRDWTEGDDRSVGWLRTTARLRDGVTLEAAQAQVDATMDVVNASITSRDGGTDLRVDLVPVKDDLVGGASRTLWMLMFAVCGVLLIAASNVAHLMLARAEGREAEVAVRTALGGSRGRLVRQMLVEGALLAGVGGFLGFVLSRVGVTALLALAPPTLPRVDEITVGPGVLGFALGATALACLLFAVVPAARASRSDVSRLLGERNRTGGPGRQRMSRALIVVEVALSLALLTSTGLLLRSLSGLARVDLGFETEGIVTFAVETPGWGSTAEEAAATMTAYEQRLRSVPGVRAVGFTNRVPLGGGLFTGTLRSSEMIAAEAESVETSVRYVSPEYLETVGGRLLAGRAFRSDDDMDVVLLDETAAARLARRGPRRPHGRDLRRGRGSRAGRGDRRRRAHEARGRRRAGGGNDIRPDARAGTPAELPVRGRPRDG